MELQLFAVCLSGIPGSGGPLKDPTANLSERNLPRAYVMQSPLMWPNFSINLTFLGLIQGDVCSQAFTIITVSVNISDS